MVNLASADVAALLKLQTMQLADAGQRLAQSATSVMENLEGMAANIAAMVEESSGLAGTSGSEQNSLLARMDEGCAAILSSLGEYTRVEAAMNENRVGPAEKIGRISASVGKMRATEMRMRQVAINARIGALHLGAPGKALSALADAINQQAGVSGLASEAVLQTVGSAGALAVRLKQESENQPDSGKEDEGRSFQELNGAISGLRELDATSLRQMREISALGKKLCDDLAAARQRFSVAVVAQDTLDRVRHELEGAMAHAQAGVWGSAEGGKTLDWTSFTKRYTMREEHEVFQRLFSGAEEESGQVPGFADQSTEDNVEFF